MDIQKSAVGKIATVKFFARKIQILKNQTAGVESYNFFVICYVCVNVIFDFSGVGNVVKTIAGIGSQFAIFVKSGKGGISAVMD